MVNKTTKAKRRRQAAERALIESALWDAVPASAGTGNNRGWPTCSALNEQKGMALLPAVAEQVAHFPRGSAARREAAFSAGVDSCIVAALGHYTPEHILRVAGLL